MVLFMYWYHKAAFQLDKYMFGTRSKHTPNFYLTQFLCKLVELLAIFYFSENNYFYLFIYFYNFIFNTGQFTLSNLLGKSIKNIYNLKFGVIR